VALLLGLVALPPLLLMLGVLVLLGVVVWGWRVGLLLLLLKTLVGNAHPCPGP
jgi:hypothetical protein